MGNAWRVFTRDVRRLAMVRKTWIILIGMLITPSLYAWLNIAAFWDPYANTGNIEIAVANLDEGATSQATGDIDVGAQVVDALAENDQLGWHFVDEDEAMESVRSGSGYAAIIIPADFSRDFTSITTGDFNRPRLQYHVNEKSSAVAPEFTDVGASTLDRQINSMFVSVVAEAVTEQLSDTGRDAENRLQLAQGDTLDALAGAADTVGSARGRVTTLQSGLGDVQNRLDSVGDTLGTVDTTLDEVQTAVGQAQQIATEVQQELLAVTDSATSAFTAGTMLLADASSRLGESVTTLASGVRQADAEVGSAIDDVTALITTRDRALADLRSIDERSGSDTAQVGAPATALEERIAADQAVLDDLRQLSSDIADVTAALEDSARVADSAVQDAATSAGAIRSTFLQTVPELNRAMSTLSASAGGFSAAIDAQRSRLGQVRELLTAVGEQLGTTSTTLTALDEDFARAGSGIEDVRTDVLALGNADVWDQLGTLTGLNPAEIGEFLASPVEVREHAVFPVEAYGSAMAPLFTNLALWVGAFVLMVIMRLEVDTEGVDDLTERQAYLGRWMLLAVIAVFQALAITIGSLITGVETINPFGFIGTGVLIGLAYLSIIYALSVSFGLLGKGLVVLLVIMQIPGASGLYPIELLPGFFRVIYNVLPFTYGIGAMREMIAGFYGSSYWRDLGVLALFVASAFILGLFLRRRLGNLIRMFNSQLADTRLLVSEDVQVTTGRHRLSQLIDALVDSEGFRADVLRREKWFTHRYPTLLRLTLLVGVLGVVVIGFVGRLTPAGKGTVLALWVTWGLLVMVFLLALEYTRQQIQLASEVGRMPEDELRETLASERVGTRPSTVTAPAADDSGEAPDEPDGGSR